MKTSLNLSICPLLLSVLAGCASQEPPMIALDEPVEAQRLPEPPKPIEVVEVPKPLALPAQLKPLPETQRSQPAKEPADERVRVSRANRDARVAPSRAEPRGLYQRHPGLALLRWRAVSGLCQSGASDSNQPTAGRGAGNCGRR